VRGVCAAGAELGIWAAARDSQQAGCGRTARAADEMRLGLRNPTYRATCARTSQYTRSGRQPPTKWTAESKRGRQPGRRMLCGWRCGAEHTGYQMRAHFTLCPNRPAASSFPDRGLRASVGRDTNLRVAIRPRWVERQSLRPCLMPFLISGSAGSRSDSVFPESE